MRRDQLTLDGLSAGSPSGRPGHSHPASGGDHAPAMVTLTRFALLAVIGLALAAAAGHPGSARVPLNPWLVLSLAGVLGTLGHLLWGDAGRLPLARRQGIGAQLVARPLQRLHLGRICLYCGRLHLAVATRRDVWSGGAFCSAACFVAAEDADRAASEAGRADL